MEQVKYRIAIKTYMEIFDYLINNDIFIFASGKDFLDSKITISEYGFMRETQILRNTWDEQNDIFELVPSIYVLNILTDLIDTILYEQDIPTINSSDYAYINNTQAKITGEKVYYPSYRELLKKLKDAKEIYDQMLYSGGKIINFNFFNQKKFVQIFSKLTNLEKRTIECYTKLEEELINATKNLLMIDKDAFPVEEQKRHLYKEGDMNYPLRYASQDNYIEWEEFKNCIYDTFIVKQFEDDFEIQGIYKKYVKNPYKSVLGLDGITK